MKFFIPVAAWAVLMICPTLHAESAPSKLLWDSVPLAITIRTDTETVLRVPEACEIGLSPALSALSLLVMLIVGTSVSTLRLSCVAAVLALPAASVKVPPATSMVAGVVLLAVGVKVAV